MKYYEKIDLHDFWDNSDYALEQYVEEFLDDDTILETEKELGYKLPESYIELMKNQNGGMPKNNCYPTKENIGWADNHISIDGIMAIGKRKPNSLCGSTGSKFYIEEWGYPEIGVVICDTPTAGHTMVMLDYRKCGPTGEPEVVFIDQENDYKISFLAKDFETFISGLVSEKDFDL